MVLLQLLHGLDLGFGQYQPLGHQVGHVDRPLTQQDIRQLTVEGPEPDDLPALLVVLKHGVFQLAQDDGLVLMVDNFPASILKVIILSVRRLGILLLRND